MAHLNKVLLIGNLTRDPELTYIASGTAVVKTSIAINENWTKDGVKHTSVQFINLTIWGKGGETFAKYTQKGSLVYIEGKMKIDKVEKDGNTRYYTNVVVKEFQFLNRKTDGDGATSSESQSQYSGVGVDPGFAGLPETEAVTPAESDWAIPGSDGDAPASTESEAATTAPVDAVVDDSDIPF